MDLCLLKEVFEACGPPDWSDRRDVVHLTLTNAPIQFQTLRSLEDCEVFPEGITDQTGISTQTAYDGGSPGKLVPGSSFTLRLPRIVGRCVVAVNLADLLSLPSATWQAPMAYFLVEEEVSKQSFCFHGIDSLNVAPTSVRRYHEALKLWVLLLEKADHITETKSLLFLGVRRIEVKPVFGPENLIEDIALNEISDFIQNSDQPETRVEIFQSVLSEFLRDQKSERAFGYLLLASGLFARRLKEGLAIYLAAHSPERLAEEARLKHLELTEKLERIINGIEGKSLTIPAAVLLAIKEVQFGEGWTTLNSIILSSAVLYLIAMSVSHFGQRATLKLMGSTIVETTKDLRKKGLNDSNPVLGESFSSLERRRKYSAIGSWAMWAFSWEPIIAVCFATFVAESPSKHGAKTFSPPPTNAPIAQSTSKPSLTSPSRSAATMVSNVSIPAKPSSGP